MNHGILYIVWGEQPLLQRSIESVGRYHPELPVHVERLPEGATLLDKARMFDLSPFDVTCFLDADTVAMGNLDYGFEAAERHDLACCICECPWARRYPTFTGDEIEYNTGVIFFSRHAERFFEEWEASIGTPSYIDFHVSPNEVKRMPLNDQASFTAAMRKTNTNPHVLPMNWNFRPLWHKSLFGPIKIWHDTANVPEGLHYYSDLQAKPSTIIQYAEIR